MKNKFLAIPYVVWMAIFVVTPLVLVVIYAFTSRDGGFTLDNFAHMGDYASVFVDSFVLATIATLICLLIAYPVAYFLSRESEAVRRVAMVLIMMPMWMNFLLRTYAWMSILENTGILNRFFQLIHIPDLVNLVNGLLNGAFGLTLATDLTYIPMINTPGAVVLGMVYNFLPFMILPIFSVIQKIDPKVIEAAQDLGANSAQTFRHVIFPLSLPGVISGITMVFIPSVSTFVISQLLGGGLTLLLGDIIQTQFYGNAYNPYLGSAISLVMMVIVLVTIALMNHFGDRTEGVRIP